MLLEDKKEKIAFEVIKVLITRIDNFPQNSLKNRNAPFHEYFLVAFLDKLLGNISDISFFISLSSWLHGLNTTLGQIFFENIAQHLSNGIKKEYTSRKLGNLKITQAQRETISQIISDLSTSTISPNLVNENQRLFIPAPKSDVNISAQDFSADVFIETNSSIIAIELKTVKPNSGEMKGEKQKILEGKAALYHEYPNKQIFFYIGFPFDPTVNPADSDVTSHNKNRFLSSIINMNKYFDPQETLIANELWDLLSGQKNTMQEILNIIQSISTTSFFDHIKFLNDSSNRQSEEYVNQLKEWHLYSELELLMNEQLILQKIKNNKALTKIYEQTIFDDKGDYRWDRYQRLKALFTEFKLS